ncbi:plasmid mobilization protein [Desulfovibrio porci]|uniref:plasmid mobilization protein n=1 Tax=Desulfovibrio porci TaxID=2605782 RepID=UPI0038995D86
MHAGKRNEAVSNRVGCSSLQDGSCLTPATILPKASPLDSPGAFGASLLTLSKRRKDHEEKQRTRHKISAQTHGGLTAAEDEKLTRQAATAGVSVSEYTRRLLFGGRPIIARTDDQTIRELRRLGGLLKHHCTDIRVAGRAKSLEEVNRTLQSIRRTIEALSKTA